MGYGRARAIPYHHIVLLPWCARYLRRLRCHRHGQLQQRQAVAARDRSLRHRGSQQAAGRQQERYDGQEGRGVHRGKGLWDTSARFKIAELMAFDVQEFADSLGIPFLETSAKNAQQRRASLPDHGTPDQGAHGQHDGQQQANGASRAGPRRPVRQRRWVLLNGSLRAGKGIHRVDDWISTVRLKFI